MSPHYVYFATIYFHTYIVYFSIFYAYIAFILFYCSCSDLDNLAAFSSPVAKDRANYFYFAFGFGLDHLENTLAILLVIKSMIKL